MFFRFGRRKKESFYPRTMHAKADAAFAARDFKGAEQLYRRLLDAAPDYTPAWFGAGQSLIEQGDFAAARELLMRAVQHVPQEAALHSYLANLHFHLGDVVAALAACEQATALNPNDVASRANLSNLRLAHGDLAGAVEAASDLLGKEPDMAGVRLTLARALDLQGEDEAALSHYLACLQAGLRTPELLEGASDLLVRLGRLDQAGALIDTYGLDGTQALPLHFKIGVAAYQAGNLNWAVTAFRSVIALDPGQHLAHANVGLILNAGGAFDEALREIRTAERLAPEDAYVQFCLASILTANGPSDEALAAMRRATLISPQWAEAHANLGRIASGLGQYDDALSSAVRALEIDSSQTGTRDLLGDIYVALGRFDEAVREYGLVLEAAPGTPRIHTRLGRSLAAQKQHAAASQHFHLALEQDPDDLEAALQCAATLMQSGAFDTAATLLQALLVQRPDEFAAHTLLGSALAELGRFIEARDSYNRTLALKPDHVDALASRGLLDLLLGDFAAGWEGYRYLTQQTGMVGLPDFGSPLWQNDADLHGKSLLLYADQGMGDAMQFVRYLDQLAPLGCRIHLAVQPALIPLLVLLPWQVTVSSKDEALPATDYHCPLGLLPRAFATRLDSIPAPMPYLFAPAVRQAWWRQYLGGQQEMPHGLGRAPNVGLVWAGNPLFSGDRDRSVPLELIERLFGHPRCRFYSLQKEPRPGDAERIATFDTVTNLGPDLKDFAETAAIIANLDLVVTVDTSVAHLAGAMGKPVWIMLPFSPDFRWMLERSDSPWYPSARLFRQGVAGDWTSVVEQVRVALFAEF